MPRPKPFVALHGQVDFDRLGPAGAVAGPDVFVCRQAASGDNVEVTATQMAAFMGGTVPDPLELSAGSEAAPSYTFTGRTDTGMFSPAADQVALSAGGVEGARVQENGAGVVQLVLPQVADQTLPQLAFGDGDSGIHENSDDVLRFAILAVDRFEFNAADFRATASNGPGLRNSPSNLTQANIHPRITDADTGIGSGGTDDISIIAGAQACLAFEEVSSQVLQFNNIHTGITASTIQTQGNGQLLSSYNEVATVANINDTVTAPLIGSNDEGMRLIVINNGANTMQLFPNTSDDLGAGVNIAVTIAAGIQHEYIAISTSVWQRIIL